MEPSASDVNTEVPDDVAWWRSPPRWVFHSWLAAALIVVLWSASFPGLHIPGFYLSSLAIAGLGIVWLIRLVGWLTLKNPSRPWRWLFAPPLVVLTVILVTTHMPLRARFEFARSDFDEFVEPLTLHAQGGARPPNWIEVDTPESLGSYDIRFAYQVGENVIIYDATGGLFNDAGFAYLPDGPDSELENGGFESPVFVDLGGDWYAWTASW